MRSGDYIWHKFYAWRPVFPSDDHGIFWLEYLWRRRDKHRHCWVYRSFRTKSEKEVEQMNRLF